MPIKDQVKNFAKKLVEHHPDAATLRGLVRARKPAELHFRDDGIVPNNPKSRTGRVHRNQFRPRRAASHAVQIRTATPPSVMMPRIKLIRHP